MASTYSNLKIQLMATGENNSTWGTVTNVNLGTAIEEAITGSADVTFASGDVTLTLTNTNATQTARNLRLNLTGTTGGARNLIVPAIEKLYLVNNGCADAVTVKNSTGSGIAVPAGKTMYVYNTGSNVVDAVTHLTSLTLGTPLAVAQGGTGATSLNGLTFTGENITNLNASNISSGTIANARTTASSSNGASTIVARGASGEFSAGVITADGSGLTALNASNISTGTIANARTTASSSNGASTIVLRDASGNFSANSITATQLFGNASTATSATTATSASSATNATFATQLANSRTFEISGGATASATSFNGTGNVNLAVSALNASNLNAGTVPAARLPSGTVVKTQLLTNSTANTFNGGSYTVIPLDSSIPQSSEGALAFQVSYTPLFSDSILIIEMHVNMATNTSSRQLVAALFYGGSADAIITGITYTPNNNSNYPVVGSAAVTAGTTSPVTISVRISSSEANTVYINNTGPGYLPQLSSTFASSVKVTEYRP